MKTWVKTSLILCVFGFLKEFRPSDMFITAFLVGPAHNFTEVQVNQQIYPVETYTQLTLLVLVFLVTDLLRYKPVILFEGFAGIASFCLFTAGNSIEAMQAAEFFYGALMATEVAYYTYIYAQVEREHYQKVTSYTRAAFLLGRFTSSTIAQSVVSTEAMSYYQLNFITLGAMFLATAWAFFLPTAKRSIYFHNNEQEHINKELDVRTTLDIEREDVSVKKEEKNLSNKCMRAYGLLWKDFKDAFTNLYVVKWSLWWALGTCGHYQVILYVQVLWETILKESAGTGHEVQTLYNGAVEAVYTILGMVAVIGCSMLRLNWQVFGDVTLAAFALLQGVVMITSSYASSMWVAYSCFVVFGIVYNTAITIVNSEVAQHINEDSYGLIFGVNTFFALLLQTILTAIVAGEGGLALPPRSQFLVYGGYFVVLGSIFAVLAIVALCGGKHRNQPSWLPKEPLTPKT